MPVPGFKKYFDNHIMLSNKPMIVLKNGISKDFLAQINLDKTKIDKVFTVIYSGNFGLAQGLNTIIKSAEILKDYPINFIMIGDGLDRKKLKDSVNHKKLNNITFYKPIERKKLIKMIKKSSLCLVPLKKDNLFKTALPSKMFEYMACSRPIVCNYGDAGEIVKRIKSGKVIEPENAQLMSNAILYYFNNKSKVEEDGENGYNYIKSFMIKENLLGDALSKIANKS